MHARQRRTSRSRKQDQETEGRSDRENLALSFSPSLGLHYANTSFTTSPPSTILIGRPMLLMFCLSASIARAWQAVRSKSLTETGRSFTASPPASVEPITWPPFTPPPARTEVKA